MWNIALNTFREIVRNKFLSIILVFAFAFIVFSISLWALSLWNENKVIVDFGLAMIELFGIAGVLFVGSQLLFNEIHGKTIFLILSKPIKRSEFICWKFLWFSMTIFLIIFLQSLLFLGVLIFKGIDISALVLFSLLYTFIKLEILLSIVLFLSTFMSNMLTIIVSMMLYFISHSLNLILDMLARTKNEILFILGRLFAILFPPLEALNTKDFIGFKDFDTSYLLLNTAYGIWYLCFLLFFSVLIFNRKNFEA